MTYARLTLPYVLAALAGVGCGSTSPANQPAANAAQDSRASATSTPSPAAGTDDLGDYPVPVPVDTVARASDVPRVETRQMAAGEATAATKAVEIRVEGVQELATLNGRPAPPGRAFVVLDTSWKNIIPLQPAKAKPTGRSSGAGGLGFGVAKESAPATDTPTMEPTPYMVGEVPKHLWLLTDNRYADPVDGAATAQVPGPLPTNRFIIPRLNDVLKGKAVFVAPAGARSMALLFLDTTWGNALIPVKGASGDVPAPKTIGSPQRNELLELAITEAGWATTGPQPPEGFRYFVVGLRGMSRSAGNIVQLELANYVFLEDEQALVAQPEPNPNWLPRPLRGLAPFLPVAPNEGQLAFLLPADTQHTMLVLRPPQGGAIDLPAPDQVKPAWPQPATTIADGGTVKINVLPAGAVPAGVREPPAGRQYFVLDLVAENLLPKGVELQPNQQFRLQDASGATYLPVPETSRLRFHPTGRGVVPANGARRVQLLYLVPTGQALRLAYRGFEKTETIDLP